MNVISLPYKWRVALYQVLKLASAAVGALFVIAPLFGWELPNTKLDALDQLVFAVVSLLGLGAGSVATEHAKISTDGPLPDPRAQAPQPDPMAVAAQTVAMTIEGVLAQLERLAKPQGE
ncbi:hypothetical protein Srot_0082 [Segniliparus rotundus DSM 44985]|uniref:Uncharacterized protein n=1 Tax=Segniliparus rotundus (strain ATCC BAA-972 / CDC 1076 / CIP 108378 / DSM 44985 / JCM 13578) TaxID=640132 RepID=D6Z9P8_SEGRD|nr:hypothetical protein [Segniliparus rotundus]ADG96575.1 hypothetical protein Srot_0082 [Segniliparus rotundus DSM 44985]